MQRHSNRKSEDRCRGKGVVSKELRRSYSLKRREAGVRPRQLYGVLGAWRSSEHFKQRSGGEMC